VAEVVAELKGTTRDEVAEATTANFVRIFAP
jgi:Tat protein secretion system quality control protein TatD with DNase activity